MMVMDNIWVKIAIAAMLGLMVWRMVPVAKHWLEHGPRGSSKEWLNVSVLLAGVVLFVVLLMSLV